MTEPVDATTGSEGEPPRDPSVVAAPGASAPRPARGEHTRPADSEHTRPAESEHVRREHPGPVGPEHPGPAGPEHPGPEHPDGAQQVSTTDRIEAEAARLARNVRRINRAVNARSGRNLLIATLVGLLLVGVMFASLIFDKRWFALVGAAAIVVVAVELATAMRRQGRHVPRVPTGVSAGAVVLVAFFYGPTWQWIATLLGLALVVAWRAAELMLSREQRAPELVARDFTSSVFVQFYVVFLGSFTALLCAQPDGQWWVIGFMVVVACVDIGGYATGLKFGRHKMAPSISPGKTWEGMAGSVLFATTAATLLSVFVLDRPVVFGIVFGIVLTIAAVAGDLTESMIKRDLGIKDMSNWLPGHGGFFDRFDSMLPAGAIAFAFYFWSVPWDHAVAAIR